jgi:hypothetical protein
MLGQQLCPFDSRSPRVASCNLFQHVWFLRYWAAMSEMRLERVSNDCAHAALRAQQHRNIDGEATPYMPASFQGSMLVQRTNQFRNPRSIQPKLMPL